MRRLRVWMSWVAALAVLAACDSSAEEPDVVEEPAPSEAAPVSPRSETEPPALSEPTVDPWTEARDRGVGFRAVGNEPGWSLEIVPGQWIHFIYQYGERELFTPLPEGRTDPESGRLTYHTVTESHDLRVDIEEQDCSDTMSGEAFPTTVHVTLGGTLYRGCGRLLIG